MENQPRLTAMEVEFFKFLGSGTHIRRLQGASFWFQEVGSDDDQRVDILSKAHDALVTATKNKMKCEAEYAALFEDIKTHESRWFDVLLKNKYNYNLCDNLCVVLGTYASLKRNRCEMEAAWEILKVATRILDIYEERVLTPGLVHSCTLHSHLVVHNLHGLRYKQNMVWMHLLLQLIRNGLLDETHYDRVVKYYRALIRYEIKYNKIEEGNGIYSAGLIMKFNRRNLTLDDLDSTIDEEFLGLFVLIGIFSPDTDPHYRSSTLSKQAALKSCAHCHKQEPTRGAFQCCALCRVAHYCSRECQTAGWTAGHKRECKGKNKSEAK